MKNRTIRITESRLKELIAQIITENEEHGQFDEEVEGSLPLSKAGKKIMRCFNQKKHPNLWKVSQGSTEVLLGALCIILGYTTLNPIVGGFGMVSGGGILARASIKLKGADMQSLSKEANDLLMCLKRNI